MILKNIVRQILKFQSGQEVKNISFQILFVLWHKI